MDRWIHNVVTNNIRKGKIAESDAEIYEYGYTLMVEKIMIFVISVAIALLLDAVWEVLALCIAFIPLRVYSGGYHAKSRWGCMVMSGAFFVLSILGVRIIQRYIDLRIFVFIELFFGIVLFGVKPVDVKQRVISESERRYFGKKVVIIIGWEMVFGILFLYCCKNVFFASSVLVSTFFICCSVIGGLVHKN